MKNYRYLIPLLLVVLFFASIYMLYSTNAEIESTYNSFLESAREYRKQEILVDAEKQYMEAVNVKPSLELDLEIGEMYVEFGKQRKAENWGEDLLEKYPEEVAAYEYMMNIYLQNADIPSCFDLYDSMKKRSLQSEKISKIMSGIEYAYYLKGSYDDVGMWCSGYCPVKKGSSWTYVSSVGTTISDYKFANVGSFASDMAPVITKEGEAFFIDTNANKKKTVADVVNIEDMGMMTSGIYTIYNGRSWGFYDSENNFLFGEYKEASSMANGVAAVKTDRVWKLINTSGEDLTDKTYSEILIDERNIAYSNGRIFTYSDSAYRMIDINGNVIGNRSFEDARPFVSSSYAAVKINGKWGFVDSNGEIKISAQYDEARSFSNGFAAVKSGGYWGFIDEAGNMVVDPAFADAKDFSSKGCAPVFEKDEWTLLCLYKYNH